MSDDHLPNLVHEQIVITLDRYTDLSHDEIERVADQGMDAVIEALPDDREPVTTADMEVFGR